MKQSEAGRLITYIGKIKDKDADVVKEKIVTKIIEIVEDVI